MAQATHTVKKRKSLTGNAIRFCEDEVAHGDILHRNLEAGDGMRGVVDAVVELHGNAAVGDGFGCEALTFRLRGNHP